VPDNPFFLVGINGGKARAKAFTATQRVRNAKLAEKARWKSRK